MFDEDFSSVCGEFADFYGDGTVDMEEYLNEEDDYNRIRRKMEAFNSSQP